MQNLTERPTIWMNLTTTANWNRPAVGVVRVEQSLYAALSKILPAASFKKCVWLDGKFVEYEPSVKVAPIRLQRVIDALLPDIPSMSSARSEILRSLENAGVEETLDYEGDERLEISILNQAVTRSEESAPVAGDVIVTVGLDWDQPFSREFYRLRKKDGLKIITCCHDVIPMLYPQYCVGDVARHFKEYFLQLIWGSAGVLCFSEQSKRDLTAFRESVGAPRRPVRVVRLGDSIPNKNGIISDGVKEIAAKPFVLFVSTIERRKNHEVLYRAYHQLCASGHRLKLPKMLFVGMPGWGVNDLMKDIELDPLTRELFVQLHHVTDAELNFLYEHTSFCVYPSLYEGWGLPVAEALVYGKAILCSNRGSLPEVGGALVKYLEPWDTAAWSAAILELVESPAKIRALEQGVKANYVQKSWSGTAKATVNLINEIIDEDAGKPTVILPGYECQTLAGEHIGACIRSNGERGHMLYGPYISHAPGCYELQVFDTLALRQPSSLFFDVVHGDEFITVAGKHVTIPEQVGNEEMASVETPLVTLNFQLPHAVKGLQIRCYLFEGSIEIAKLVILRLDRIAPVNDVETTIKLPAHQLVNGRQHRGQRLEF
jgi:glycosyltransferase involved in cell wall biosynthesis